MNIALVGAGAIAREHLLALRALLRDDLSLDPQVVGVVAPRPGAAAAFAAEHGIPRSATDPRHFLADPSVDAVLICSPSAMHAPQVAAALRAGKHVLCEIPLALSLAEARALRDLAAERDRTLMVAHTLRFRPALLAVREQIARQALNPTAIIARYLFRRRSNVGWTGRQRSWTDNLLWHHGCHAVDTCLWLLGTEAAEVVSIVAPPDPERHVPLDLSLGLRTPAGTLATIALSYNSALSVHDYVVIGRDTTLLATPEALMDADGREVPGALDAPPHNPLVAQDAEFLAAVRDGRAPTVSADAVLPALAVLQAVADAAGLGPTPEEAAAAAAALLDTLPPA